MQMNLPLKIYILIITHKDLEQKAIQLVTGGIVHGILILRIILLFKNQ